MPEKVIPPSRREIVASAAISVAVIVAGCVVTILVGFPAFWVDLAMTDPTADPWFLALVRADRRSLVDLVVGVAPHTTASPKLGKPLLWPPPSA